VQGISGGTPVPVSGTVAVTGPLSVTQGTSPWVVSGTVTANIGTTGGLALDATLAKLTIVPGTAIGSNTGALPLGSVTTAAPTYVTGQLSPLSLTTTGALRVDGTGGTQPISGTVTANQGTSPWVVSGTVTANIGTTNGLALDASLQSTYGTVAAGTAATKSTLIGGVFNTSLPTLTNGQQAAFQLDSSGRQIIAPLTSTTSVTANPTVTTVTFQTEGSIAFGSLTTSYATIFTTGGVLKYLQIRNSCDALVSVSLDGGSTTAYVLAQYDAVSIDLATNRISVPISTVFQAKYTGTAPTVGAVRINGGY